MESVGGEPLPYPEKATLLGAVRVIPHEFAGVHCQSVDVALPAAAKGRWWRRVEEPGLDAVADALHAELLAERDAPVVAHRGAHRYEEGFASAAPPAAGAGTPRLRHGGVYLVTGGLGGIGFALALELAREHAAKLVLVGRRGLPPEEKWDAWLASHGERDATS